MRKIAMLVALAVALLALGAGAVFAQEEGGSGGSQEGEGSGELEGAVFTGSNNQVIQCIGVPCRASGSSDLVYERVGNRKKDRILLGGGDDQSSDQRGGLTPAVYAGVLAAGMLVVVAGRLYRDGRRG